MSQWESLSQPDEKQESSQKHSGVKETCLKPFSNYKRRKRPFKAFLEECRFDIVRNTLSERGAVEVDYGSPWIIAWTDALFPMERYTRMKSFQKINHFPGMSQICKKDLLATNLKRMKRRFGNEYNFFPLTFCLPDEAPSFSKYCRSRRMKEPFIIKPDSSSSGSGIDILKGLDNVKNYRNVVCQKYIEKPLLMDSFKFDLRLYALVTSVCPLRVYLYKEGLVRLATVPYKKPSLSNMHEKRMHLTNYAINRGTYMEECSGQGCKRSLSELEVFLDSLNVDRDHLWPAVDGMIVKTLLSILPTLQRMFRIYFPIKSALSPCFELLGFDVLLNSRVKPYLLEVNRSPSLSGTSAMDRQLKKALVENVLDMVLPTPKQISILNEEQHMKSLRRLTNPNATKHLTAKEMIMAEYQEKRERKETGNFRQIYPVEDGRYDQIIRTLFESENSYKKTTATSSSIVSTSKTAKTETCLKDISKP